MRDLHNQPPRNRAERRALKRPRHPNQPHQFSSLPEHNQPRIRIAPLSPLNGGSDPLESEPDVFDEPSLGRSIPIEDAPPTNRRRGGRPPGSKNKPKDGSAEGQPSKRVSSRARVEKTLLGYHGTIGAQIGKLNAQDGVIIVAGGADATAALMQAYDTDPRARKVLEAMTIGGPWFVQVAIAYGGIALALMANHEINPLEPIARYFRQRKVEQEEAIRQAQAIWGTPQPAPQSTPIQFNGDAVAASAAVAQEAMHGPDHLDGVYGGAIPDEGLPWEADKQIRELSRKTGRPYQELRQEALVMIAQLRMAQASQVQQPGTLGAPVAKE